MKVPGIPAPAQPAGQKPSPEDYLMAAADLHFSGALKDLVAPPPKPKAK